MPIDQDVDREIRRLDARLDKFDMIPTTLAVVVERQKEIKAKLDELEDRFDARGVERGVERERASERRRSDRRWLVGTLVACTGTVIAAVAVIVSALG